jgi:prepilin peptidase CpaA
MLIASPIYLFTVVAFLALVGYAAVTDVRTLRIPNPVSLAVALLYPAYVLASPVAVDWLAAIGIAAAVFLVGLGLFVLRWMGGGDVKLMAAASLWAGSQAVVPFLAHTALAGGAIAILMLAPVRFALAVSFERVGAVRLRDAVLGRSIPYAVAIAIGTLTGVAPVLLQLPH